MNRILFNRLLLSGPGSFAGLPGMIAGRGRRCLLVTGKNSLKNSGRLDNILSHLKTAGVEKTALCEVSGEPDTETVAACLRTGEGADFVLACGGGSTMDAAKAAAALLVNEGPIEKYLEITPHPEKLKSNPLPLFVLPTTAGTGTEASQNAVIIVRSTFLKASIRDPRLLPEGVILDPELVADVPAQAAAAAGMDALTQLIEAYTGMKNNPFLDAMIEEAISRISRSLFAYCRNRADPSAALAMQIAAYVSGLALANIGLGAVHALARPIGSAGLPHGLVCAVLLPLVTRLNTPSAPARYASVARLLGSTEKTDAAAAEGLASRLAEMNRQLGLPENFRGTDIRFPPPEHILAAAQGGSLRNNPRDLSAAELTNLLILSAVIDTPA